MASERISPKVVSAVIAHVDDLVRKHSQIFSLTDDEGDTLIVNGAHDSDAPGSVFYLNTTVSGVSLNPEQARLLIAFLALQLEEIEGATE